MAARRVSKGPRRSRATTGARKAGARKAGARKTGARKTAKRVARGKRKTAAKKKAARTTHARTTPARKSPGATARARAERAAPAAAVVDPFDGGEPEPDEMLDELEEMPSGIDDLVDDDSFSDEDDFNS
jgi:hypothetical protein